MKKIKSLFRILFFLAIVSAVSCEKLIDYLPGKPKNCRIKRIHFLDGPGNYYGDFYYNKFGNPDSVKFGFVGTGYPDLYFKYNNKRQLKQALFLYSNGAAEAWHKLGYTNNLITTDTVFIWSSLEEPEPLYYYTKAITYFEYDNLGRVTKTTHDWVSPDYDPLIESYAYDAFGNWISYQDLSYDNYTNIHTLHPIWQLFERDYSLNNPITATSYNDFRLPLGFDYDRPSSDFQYHFLYRSLHKASIEYDCK